MEWSSDIFEERLNEYVDDNKTLERCVRLNAKNQIRDWRTAELFPVVGYHPKYQLMPELLGVALVGLPRDPEDSAVVLYSLEDDLSDELCEFVDSVMELGDGLDTACEIMLAYHRAIIPVNGESLEDWFTIFEDVAEGRRSTNYLKLKQNHRNNRVQATLSSSLDEFLNEMLKNGNEEFVNNLLDFEDGFKERWS